MSGAGFFGLTTLGRSEGTIADTAAASTSWPFHEIPEDVYIATFNK